MFDRLMGRAILAKADAVVRHHVDHARFLQRRKPDRSAAIVGEHEEGAAIRDNAAMQRHAVHRGGHAEFADAVVDVATGIVVRRERADPTSLGVVRAGQVGAAAHGLGQLAIDLRKRHFAGLARRDLLRFGDELADIVVETEAFGQVASHTPLEVGAPTVV